MPLNVFRAKGILWFDKSELKHIFQLSGPRYEMQAEEWNSLLKNQLVLIGRDLDEESILQDLNGALVSNFTTKSFSLPNLPF